MSAIRLASFGAVARKAGRHNPASEDADFPFRLVLKSPRSISFCRAFNTCIYDGRQRVYTGKEYLQ